MKKKLLIGFIAICLLVGSLNIAIAARTQVSTPQRVALRDMGTALSFDGADDYVEIPDANLPASTFTGGFTLSAWINPKSLGEIGGRIFDKSTGTSGNDGFTFTMQTNNIAVRTSGGSAVSTQINSIRYPLNWTNVSAVVASDGTITLYINGVQSGTPAKSTSISGITTTNPLRIGNYSVDTIRSFNGIIDSPHIWNRALTATEVSDLYYNNIVPTSGLVAQYLFNEASGTTALDTSGNGNDGTISGATYTTDVASRLRSTTTLSRLPVGQLFRSRIDEATGDVARTMSGWIEDNRSLGWFFTEDVNYTSAEFDTAVTRTGAKTLKLENLDTSGRCHIDYPVPNAASTIAISEIGNLIKVKPSTTYKLSFYYKTINKTSGYIGIVMTYNRNTRTAIKNLISAVGTTDGWVLGSGTLVTGASDTGVVIRHQTNAGAIESNWFDVNSMTLEEVGATRTQIQ